jgi:hypothetical protein
VGELGGDLGGQPRALRDELRDEIIGLLAEPPMRIEVHPYAALPS